MSLPEHYHHGQCPHCPPHPHSSPYPMNQQVGGPYPVSGYAYPPQRPNQAGQVAKWAAIGGIGALGLLAFAVAAVAVAVGAVAVTICVLVLRGLWNDAQKEKR